MFQIWVVGRQSVCARTRRACGVDMQLRGDGASASSDHTMPSTSKAKSPDPMPSGLFIVRARRVWPSRGSSRIGGAPQWAVAPEAGRAAEAGLGPMINSSAEAAVAPKRRIMVAWRAACARRCKVRVQGTAAPGCAYKSVHPGRVH